MTSIGAKLTMLSVLLRDIQYIVMGHNYVFLYTISIFIDIGIHLTLDLWSC